MQDNHSELELALIEAGRGMQQAKLPDAWPEVDEAYAIQRRVAARAKLPVMIWKLGVTSQGARDAFRVREPVVGRLPASAIYSDNSDISYVAPEMYAEAELVFEIGRDLPDKSGAYTRDDICASLKGVYAGIEIVRSRFTSTDLPLTLLIADNVMGHGLVWGRRLASGWEDRFADMPVSLTRNTEVPVEGTTRTVMGNPLDAVVWLANWLRNTEGQRLRKEQLVASGSCTGATMIFADDLIRVDFDGANAARVSLCNPK